MRPRKNGISTFAYVSLCAVFASSGLFSQTVLFESSKSIETLQNGVVNIGGSLAFKDSSVTLTADDQLVTVGVLSYLRIKANTFISMDRTVTLSDGVVRGQILFLECIGGAWELVDNPVINNVNTSGARTFEEADIIQLMWNGTHWLEVHFSNN